MNKTYTVQPYFKPSSDLSLQGEVNYALVRDFEIKSRPIEDRDINSWSAFLDGDVNLGIFDFGGSLLSSRARILMIPMLTAVIFRASFPAVATGIPV